MLNNGGFTVVSSVAMFIYVFINPMKLKSEEIMSSNNLFYLKLYFDFLLIGIHASASSDD